MKNRLMKLHQDKLDAYSLQAKQNNLSLDTKIPILLTVEELTDLNEFLNIFLYSDEDE